MTKIPYGIIVQLRRMSQEYDMKAFDSTSTSNFDPSELDRSHWKIIYHINEMQPLAEAKHLEHATGLSRSAALKYAHELCDKGILTKAIKPGTENRSYPPYVFSLSPELRPKIVEFLNNPFVQQEILNLVDDSSPQQTNIELSGNTETGDYQNLSSSTSVQEQTDQHLATQDLVVDGTSPIQTTQSSQQEEDIRDLATAKPSPQNTDLDIGLVLKKMAEEIVLLKNRVAELEKKLEASKTPQSATNVDFEQVLSILETKQL